jgi:glycosyltransferase involved in cell wall biosynthesis
MSAAYLVASAGLPFRKRIVHLHNTSLSLPTPSKVKTGLTREPMRQVCLRMADQIVGISKDALESFVGTRSTAPGRHTVVHYAVDTERFARASPAPTEFRRRLDLGPTAKILLFVGRMVEYKNPRFLVEILSHLSQKDREVIALFAGAGNQQDEVRKLAAERSLASRVRILGFREDVPELMLSSDLFIWPSLEEPKEGLGLGIVEAQAAGLPVLMSRSVPAEAVVVPELVKVLPLTAGAKGWSNAALEMLDQRHPDRRESLARVESSSFSMAAGVRNIMALYDL